MGAAFCHRPLGKAKPMAAQSRSLGSGASIRERKGMSAVSARRPISHGLEQRARTEGTSSSGESVFLKSWNRCA